jgi:hypothetical protein
MNSSHIATLRKDSANTHRVEITETRIIFAEVNAKTANEAIVKASRGEGEVAEPYPPEVEAVKVTSFNEAG